MYDWTLYHFSYVVFINHKDHIYIHIINLPPTANRYIRFVVVLKCNWLLTHNNWVGCCKFGESQSVTSLSRAAVLKNETFTSVIPKYRLYNIFIIVDMTALILGMHKIFTCCSHPICLIFYLSGICIMYLHI